jgi:putative ABC transport system permease protein
MMRAPAWSSLFAYHLRLAVGDVRRNRGLSLAIFAGLAMATAVWSNAIFHYQRIHAPFPALDPALHQVELFHERTATGVNPSIEMEVGGWSARTRVSYPEYQRLAASGVPGAEVAALRARLLVTAAAAAEPRVVSGRLATATFFDVFPQPLRAGRAFTAAEDAGGAPVVVIGNRLNRLLFGGADSVGRTLLVEGRPFRIVGLLAEDQLARPVWDITATGFRQDALYLPFGWFRRLAIRPEHALIDEPPPGDGVEDMVRSSAQYVVFWKLLPGPAEREAYRRHLEREFPGRFQLRDYAAWQEAFSFPFGDVRFFVLLTGLMLVGGGLNAARLLLAKGFARKSELALHRALGATRRSLFLRQMLSAAVLAAPAALLGVLLAIPYAELFNQLATLSDIRVRMTPMGFVEGFFPALLLGIASAAYPAWLLSRTGPQDRARGG